MQRPKPPVNSAEKVAKSDGGTREADPALRVAMAPPSAITVLGERHSAIMMPKGMVKDFKMVNMGRMI